jgi:hypothetical protein
MTAYGYLEYSETIGDVDWLTEYDTFPLVDEKYIPKMEYVRSYGGKIQWTLLEQATNRYDMINMRLDSVMNMMRLRENATVLGKMIAKLDHTNLSNDETVSDWNDTSAGTPALDIKKGQNQIGRNTQKMYFGDSLIMNTNLQEKLYAFDFVQNNMYTSAQFMETGNIPKLAGMPVTLIETMADDEFIIFQSRYIGDWITTEALRSEPYIVNPRLFERWIWTTAEPVITHPRAMYRGTIP